MVNDPPSGPPIVIIEAPDEQPAEEYRQCSTCGATMIKASKRAWLCPNQRDQGNGISVALRIANREMAAARVASAPF